MPPEHSYTLCKNRPDVEDDYVVIDEHGDKIAQIYLSSGSTPPRWKIHVGARSLPVWDGRFNADAPDLETAKRKVKELWPIFRDHWTDEQYEKAKRDVELYRDRRFRE